MGVAPVEVGEEAGGGPVGEVVANAQADRASDIAAVDVGGGEGQDAGFLIVEVVGVGQADVGAGDPLAVEVVVGGVDGGIPLVVAIIAEGGEAGGRAVTAS